MSTLKHNYGPKSYEKEPERSLQLGNGVLIHPDGTLEAEGFRDRSSDGLEFNELNNQNGFTFQKSLDSNTDIHYIPNSVRRYYSTKVSIKHEVKDAFAEYRGEVKNLFVVDLDRYKKSKKALKTKIDEILKEKHHFIFVKNVEIEDVAYHALPYSQCHTFGPYNYQTVLKVTNQIDNINDVLIVSTGAFTSHWSSKNNDYLKTPAKGKVVFVSPHQGYTTSGNAYMHMGSGKVEKGREIVTYKSNIIIPEGQILEHEMKYYEDDDPSSLTTNTLKADISPYSTEYLKKENVFTGEWDGIVPSGAYIRIETVSTDGRYLGFDGTISIVQESGDGSPKIDVSCSGVFEGVGVDVKYKYSVAKALQAAKRKYYKKLNNILVTNGVKNKNSKMLRYEKMLERVASNVYEGLNLTRNEKVGMAQGTESSPIGSPIYYEGMSSAYGGSRQSSNYNYVDIVLDKTSDPISSILFPPTGIFMGSVSVSASAGTATSASVGGGSTTY